MQLRAAGGAYPLSPDNIAAGDGARVPVPKSRRPTPTSERFEDIGAPR
jgi:hypothetical protein